MNRVAVVDTAVLSNFAWTDEPDLLRSTFDVLVTPPTVMAEYSEGVRLACVPNIDWGWLEVTELTAPEHATASRLGRKLGRGEAECIALAQAHAWLLLTDDRDARKVAQQAGIPVSGNLGALMNLVHVHVLTLDEGNAALSRMKQHGYRCPVTSLQELGE